MSQFSILASVWVQIKLSYTLLLDACMMPLCAWPLWKLVDLHSYCISYLAWTEVILLASLSFRDIQRWLIIISESSKVREEHFFQPFSWTNAFAAFRTVSDSRARLSVLWLGLSGWESFFTVAKSVFTSRPCAYICSAILLFLDSRTAGPMSPVSNIFRRRQTSQHRFKRELVRYILEVATELKCEVQLAGYINNYTAFKSAILLKTLYPH